MYQRTLLGSALKSTKIAQKLKKGQNTLAVREVSALIRPETAILNNLTYANSLTLIEQNFDYDLLTPQHLLQKYVGKQVTVIRGHPTT